MRYRYYAFVGLLTLTVAASISATAQPTASRSAAPLADEAVLAPLSGASGFGYAVSVSGDRALVGALSGGAGKAFVYRRDGVGAWSEEAELEPLDGLSSDQFGHAVSIHGDWALVGAPLHDLAGTNSGAAYLYMRSEANGWLLAQKLMASDPVQGAQFGNSVALAGSRALVLANNGDAATIFVEEEGTWTEEAILSAPASKGYWSSAALSDSLAIIGSPNDAGQGAAFTFRLQSAGDWTADDTLKASGLHDLDLFGFSVALSGDRAVVGAIGNDDIASESGAVYVFDRSATGEWSDGLKLKRPSPPTDGRLGFSVAVENGRVLTGAVTALGHSGDVILFESSVSGQWEEAAILIGTDVGSGDQYGVSVALDGDRALVGAVLDGLGSAHAFDLSAIVAASSRPDATVELAVGPNPTRGVTTAFVDRQAPAQTSHLIVVDALGRVVHTRALHPAVGREAVPLSTQDLPSGVYVVRLMTDGQEEASARFVVAH